MNLARAATFIACGVLAASGAAFAQQKSEKGSARQDQVLFRTMAQNNLAEVEAGKLAQDKARSDDVKKYAGKMVEDHGKMLDEQKKMAEQKQMQMPAEPAAKHKAAMKKLEAARDDQFDQAYLRQMVQDHQAALKDAQRAAKEARDPELKASAREAVPHIQQHLAEARKLSGSAAAGASGPDKQKKR